MYLARHIERSLLEAVRQFPAVALSGPRQTGKSTLLKHLFAEQFDYVTLDDMALRNQARKDPQTFLRNYPDPVIIDEVQYAPELFPEIKRKSHGSRCQSRQRGKFNERVYNTFRNGPGS